MRHLTLLMILGLTLGAVACGEEAKSDSQTTTTKTGEEEAKNDLSNLSDEDQDVVEALSNASKTFDELIVTGQAGLKELEAAKKEGRESTFDFEAFQSTFTNAQTNMRKDTDALNAKYPGLDAKMKAGNDLGPEVQAAAEKSKESMQKLMENYSALMMSRSPGSGPGYSGPTGYDASKPPSDDVSVSLDDCTAKLKGGSKTATLQLLLMFPKDEAKDSAAALSTPKNISAMKAEAVALLEGYTYEEARNSSRFKRSFTAKLQERLKKLFPDITINSIVIKSKALMG